MAVMAVNAIIPPKAAREAKVVRTVKMVMIAEAVMVMRTEALVTS
jgi:hypothetical protein